MALGERLLEALTTVIKMNDKVERLAELTKTQQAKIEDLTARVIRLETALELALAARGRRVGRR
jgi:hypothetical protein